MASMSTFSTVSTPTFSTEYALKSRVRWEARIQPIRPDTLASLLMMIKLLQFGPRIQTQVLGSGNSTLYFLQGPAVGMIISILTGKNVIRRSMPWRPSRILERMQSLLFVSLLLLTRTTLQICNMSLVLLSQSCSRPQFRFSTSGDFLRGRMHKPKKEKRGYE